MEANYVSRFGGVCASGTDYRSLPEAKLWTQVIQQAIEDLDRRTSLTSRSTQDSAREWFASESDAVGSFNWTCHLIDVDPNFIRSRLAKRQRMLKLKGAVPAMAQGAKALGKTLAALDDMDRPKRRPAFKVVQVKGRSVGVSPCSAL